MTRITATPEIHNVFNELDEFGILLGLPRLEEERNAEYKQRLLDVMVHRANSTKRGLIYGITRELGLELNRAIRMRVILDSNGTPLAPAPAIVFKDPYCYIYSDYGANTLLFTLDRFSPSGGCFTIGELVDIINSTGYFTATIDHESSRTLRSMTIFDQTSAGIVVAEGLATGSHRVQLEHDHLIEESIAVRGSNLTHRVYSEEEIRQTGDFYVDIRGGVLEAAAVPTSGSTIRYTHIDLDLYFESSPIILHDLNADEFKSKMFTKNADGDLGLPTACGADIINELLSVYPALWGK